MHAFCALIRMTNISVNTKASASPIKSVVRPGFIIRNAAITNRVLSGMVSEWVESWRCSPREIAVIPRSAVTQVSSTSPTLPCKISEGE